MSSHKPQPQRLFDARIISAAALDAVRKLDPRALAKNPVIFVTEAVSAVVTLLFLRDLFVHNGQAAFSGQIAAWLWFTVLFANFAEAVAEGRGKAQADALRKTRTDTPAKRYVDPENLRGPVKVVNAQDLKLNDVVLVEPVLVEHCRRDMPEAVTGLPALISHTAQRHQKHCVTAWFGVVAAAREQKGIAAGVLA